MCPEGGTQLERYAQALNAVEINSLFYRPHQRKTYERWAASTPEAFRFSIKMPRTITHFARLNNCDAMLDRFLDEVTGLGDRLGVLLVQLPPKLAFDEPAAGRFFADLQARIVTPVALEPRNASWFSPDLEGWLAQHRIARICRRSCANCRGRRAGRLERTRLLSVARFAEDLSLHLR
jgi:uncharacterized protein YecE (DUF72 family)